MSERVLGIARLGSIREISIYAGVAESTVNRALKGHPSVSDQTRARVISAVWEINIAKIRQINGARRRAPSDGISTWDNHL